VTEFGPRGRGNRGQQQRGTGYQRRNSQQQMWRRGVDGIGNIVQTPLIKQPIPLTTGSASAHYPRAPDTTSLLKRGQDRARRDDLTKLRKLPTFSEGISINKIPQQSTPEPRLSHKESIIYESWISAILSRNVIKRCARPNIPAAVSWGHQHGAVASRLIRPLYSSCILGPCMSLVNEHQLRGLHYVLEAP
jgi:hypothetical protein